MPCKYESPPNSLMTTAKSCPPLAVSAPPPPQAYQGRITAFGIYLVGSFSPIRRVAGRAGKGAGRARASGSLWARWAGGGVAGRARAGEGREPAEGWGLVGGRASERALAGLGRRTRARASLRRVAGRPRRRSGMGKKAA